MGTGHTYRQYGTDMDPYRQASDLDHWSHSPLVQHIIGPTVDTYFGETSEEEHIYGGNTLVIIFSIHMIFIIDSEFLK